MIELQVDFLGICVFIQTESTPNVDAMKFLPGREVSPSEIIEFKDISEAQYSHLARRLLSIKSVSHIMFGDDFISVTKDPCVAWKDIKPNILMEITDHFLSGLDVFENLENASDFQKEEIRFDPEDHDTVQLITKILSEYIRPSVAQDGGDITLVGYINNIVYLRLKGACVGCASADITLKNGVENMLCYYVPEVKTVEQVPHGVKEWWKEIDNPDDASDSKNDTNKVST